MQIFLISFPSVKIIWNLNINANYGKALSWLKIEISLVLFRTSLPWGAFHYWSFSGASVLHKLSQGLLYIWTKDLVKHVPMYVSSKRSWFLDLMISTVPMGRISWLAFKGTSEKTKTCKFLKTFLDITAWILRFLFKIMISPYLE